MEFVCSRAVSRKTYYCYYCAPTLKRRFTLFPSYLRDLSANGILLSQYQDNAQPDLYIKLERSRLANCYKGAAMYDEPFPAVSHLYIYIYTDPLLHRGLGIRHRGARFVCTEFVSRQQLVNVIIPY